MPAAPPFQGYWALESFGVTVPQSIAEPARAVDAVKRAQEACPFDALEVVWDWFAFLDVVGCTSQIADAGSPMVVKNPMSSIDEVADLEPVDTSGDERVKASSSPPRRSFPSSSTSTSVMRPSRCRSRSPATCGTPLT